MKVFRQGKIFVCAKLCDTCIFRPGDLMRLRPGRVEEMVRAAGEFGNIPCHETYGETPAVCRGFFEKHRNAVLQAGERLKLVVFQ